jgi:hypothetical protein
MFTKIIWYTIGYAIDAALLIVGILGLKIVWYAATAVWGRI